MRLTTHYVSACALEECNIVHRHLIFRLFSASLVVNQTVWDYIDTVLCTATRLSKELMREVQAIEVNLQNCIFDVIDDTYNM